MPNFSNGRGLRKVSDKFQYLFEFIQHTRKGNPADKAFGYRTGIRPPACKIRYTFYSYNHLIPFPFQYLYNFSVVITKNYAE